MKLYERFGDKGFHTSIVTTFGIDFDAYESVALPRFRGAGCSNNILLADAGMLTYALDGASVRPESAGRHYTVSGATALGVFHPKIVVQLGRRSGRLIISSANMTASGLAGNLELAGLVSSTGVHGGERDIVTAAWQYIDRRIDPGEQAIAHQRRWMRARTPWLFDTEPASGLVSLIDDSKAAFLTSGNAIGIGTRFANLVEERPVRRLVVLSPYWDEDLGALRHLVSALNPQETVILIDREKGLFPGAALRALPDAKVFDVTTVAKGRFVHAKALIAETHAADHVLYGSANCTVAALGTGNFAGTNEEACLYRQLRPGTILEALDLTKILDSGQCISADELPAFSIEEELPLDGAMARSPGRFECLYDALEWRVPGQAQVERGRIELLDANGDTLTGSLSPLAGGTGNRCHYQMTGFQKRPAFARLCFADGTISAPAIVMLIDAVRDVVREARGKRAESAALQLSDETEEGLWLLDIIDSLEAAETDEINAEEPSVRRLREKDEKNGADGEYRTLSYEEFVAGRRLRSDVSHVSRNSLAGSELSLVRGFLNRILAIGDSGKEEPENVDKAIAASLDLGDETANAEQALESGQDFSAAFLSAEADNEDTRRQRKVQAKATAEQIVKAIDHFNSEIRQKANNCAITKFDMLRLRAILMVLAASGQPAARAKKPKSAGDRHLTSLQVLPLDDSEHAWPRLMGRTLFAVFGGTRPAVRHLQLEAADDQIPDDIIECWATCFWAVQAATCGLEARKELRAAASRFTALARQIYLLTGLWPEELEGNRITETIAKLSERFVGRVDLSAPRIAEAHHRTIKELGTPR